MNVKVSNKAIIVGFTVLALAVSAFASFFYSKPVGADIVFHLDIVQVYLRGENGMFAPFVMEINRIPYPPLFHMLLLPSVALGFGNEFLRFLQMVFYPLCVGVTVWLVGKYGNGKLQMATVGLALIGSYAFLDAVFQIRPESLDMFLWLLFTFAVLNGKTKLGVLSVVAGVYNHSIPVLCHTGGILLWKKWFKQIILILLLTAPIIVISLYYMSSMVGKWFLTPGSPQASALLSNPVLFLLNYMGSLLVGLPLIPYFAFKWKTLTPLAKISLVTIASSLPLLLIWYDRFFHYISIPLAILIGTFVSSQKGLLKWYVVLFVLIFAVNSYVGLWNSNINGLWDIHY